MAQALVEQIFYINDKDQKNCHVCGYPTTLFTGGGFDAVGIRHIDPKDCIKEILSNIHPSPTHK